MSDKEVVGHLEDGPGLDYWAGQADVQVAEDTQTRLLNLVNKEQEQDKKVLELEVALAEAQEELKKTRRELLPNIMKELGVDTLKMSDGRTVKVSEKAIGIVREENKEAWFDWLEKTQNDGIIKTAVSAEFGRGELQQAKDAKAAMEKLGYFTKLDRSIHYQTQQAFVREQLAKDVALPACVDLSEFSEAKVTNPKAKK